MKMVYSVSKGRARAAVAFEGLCVVRADADDFFGGEDSQPYESRMLRSPTWTTLFACAKAQQKKTLDVHHMFFEGAYVVGTAQIGGQDVKVLRLSLGS